MRFCQGALATAILLALSLPLQADTPKRDDSASEKLGMKLSLQCYTFRALTFFETVDIASGMGIKYLEIYPGQRVEPNSQVKIGTDMSDEVIGKIKQKLADAGGLKLIAFGVNPIPEDEPGARKRFEWAKRMGLEVLVTETTPSDMHDKLANEFNIKIALHNHPESWPPEKLLAASKGKSKMIGSCSDTGHWMRAKRVPVECFRLLDGRVLHSHFKDLNMFGKDAHDVAWGTGMGDVQGMLTEMKRQGYKGYLSIEYEYGDIDHLKTNLPKCIAFFDKTMTDLVR
jgi:sugar phosphate isomerase/epimerase